MSDHINTTVLYKNSQLVNGKDEFTPVKNITRPILNLQYRAEGFDVKDIVLFVDDAGKYHLSFLVKKFHEKWALENGIDTVIDAMVESYIDFGGALLKNINDVKPEVVPLQSIVFCDQTDILSGPIGIKHYFSPDQLLDMADKGWGESSNGASASLQETIKLARSVKREEKDGTLTQTPGRYIEVYEVHGNLPKRFLTSSDTTGKYINQLQIVCFYEKLNGEKGNITLYKAEEKKSPFKFIKRDPIYGRALGFGGAEELFEAQVWVNYDMIRMQKMLDAAAVTILASTDPTFGQKNKTRDIEGLPIFELSPGTDVKQIDTFPRNIKIFEDSVTQWEAHAQQMGAANDSIMGENPTAGTPFKLQELVTSEAHSLHEYRKGKLATFWNEVEREWILPYIAREISKGQTFLAELDLDELTYVSDALITNEANNLIKEKILNGELIDPNQVEGYKEIVRTEFQKKGNKHFIEIFRGEMKGVPLAVHTNVAGKQKNLAAVVDKTVNIFRFAFSNPQGFAQVMQIPGMAKSFNDILEYSGLSPVDFSGIEKLAQQQPQPQQQAPQQPQYPVVPNQPVPTA